MFWELRGAHYRNAWYQLLLRGCYRASYLGLILITVG